MQELHQIQFPLVVELADLPRYVGVELGPSHTVSIDQPMIDAFGQITGDQHWIHSDSDRARRELPWGAPLAHGYLVLALITGMMGDLLQLRFQRALNYGLNRVRFTSPVPTGSRVCLYARLEKAEPVEEGGIRLTTACRMMIEGSDRPAFVAEPISLFYP